MNEGQYLCEVVRWHFIFSSNHWSTLDPFKDFVENTLSTYRKTQIKESRLPID
jgi:hypothetical protein